MKTIELFVQGEGIRGIEIVSLAEDATVDDLLQAAHLLGLPTREGVAVFLEDDEEPLPAGPARLVEHGVSDLARLHCHHCRKMAVTVNFNQKQRERTFPPSTTIAKVKKWADKEFELDPVDATEHALQLCNSSQRPDEDIHIGGLVATPGCQLCFDLVAKVRVEG